MGVSRGILSDLEFGGTCGSAELLQSLVEQVSEILTSIDVDDDGASCDSVSARVIHVESSSGSRSLDLPMQCEQTTISRQLKFGRTLRVSSM